MAGAVHHKATAAGLWLDFMSVQDTPSRPRPSVWVSLFIIVLVAASLRNVISSPSALLDPACRGPLSYIVAVTIALLLHCLQSILVSICRWGCCTAPPTKQSAMTEVSAAHSVMSRTRLLSSAADLASHANLGLPVVVACAWLWSHAVDPLTAMCFVRHPQLLVAFDIYSACAQLAVLGAGMVCMVEWAWAGEGTIMPSFMTLWQSYMNTYAGSCGALAARLGMEAAVTTDNSVGQQGLTGSPQALPPRPLWAGQHTQSTDLTSFAPMASFWSGAQRSAWLILHGMIAMLVVLTSGCIMLALGGGTALDTCTGVVEYLVSITICLGIYTTIALSTLDKTQSTRRTQWLNRSLLVLLMTSCIWGTQATHDYECLSTQPHFRLAVAVHLLLSCCCVLVFLGVCTALLIFWLLGSIFRIVSAARCIWSCRRQRGYVGDRQSSTDRRAQCVSCRSIKRTPVAEELSLPYFAMDVRGGAERSEVDVSSVPARLCVGEGPEGRKAAVCVAELVNSTDLEASECLQNEGTVCGRTIDSLLDVVPIAEGIGALGHGLEGCWLLEDDSLTDIVVV